MKTKILSFLMALILLCLAACGKSDALIESDSGSDSDNESEENAMQTEKDVYTESSSNENKKISILESTDIDALLARPYTDTVPGPFSEGLFSTHTNGWGFRNGSVLETGNKNGIGLPIEIKVDGRSVSHTNSTWMPSHVFSVFDSSKYFENIAPTATASASYTSQYDADGVKHLNDGVVSYSDSPRNRWTNYVNPVRKQNETLTFDFGKSVTVAYLTVYPFDDEGATLAPKAMYVEYKDSKSGAWVKAKNQVCEGISRAIGVDITFDAIQATAIRLIVTPKDGKAVGITDVKIFGKSDSTYTFADGIVVEEKKFITDNDVVASVLSFKNNSNKSVSFEISTSVSKGVNEEKFGSRYVLFGGDVKASSAKQFTLAAGKSAEYKLAVAVADKSGECANKITNFVKANNSADSHVKSFNQWFKKNVPYFDCDDEQITQIYYFRWLTYRNNIRKISSDWDGYIISEFLPNVNWAGLYNSISCPAGHHFYEGRWIREDDYLDAYQEFWFISGANPRLYSFPIADAYYNRYLVTGDKAELTKYLDKLIANYKGWENSHYVSSMGLFTQIADRDGMENGIGGDGIRTTINSYMYGDAMAIYNIALMLNNTSVANEYKAKADALRNNVMSKLWNENEAFFETIDKNGRSVNVRELIGYVPWYFNLPTDDKKYSAAFSQLLDSKGFLAEYGPTTAEQRDSKFMSSLRPYCRWDGPSWPFATSQTLVASANLLNNYKQNTSFDKGNWFDLLKTFAKSQYKNGYPWIAENLHPITGEWIVDYDRSIHYNHSSYTDIVITGLAGIRPADDDKYLTVNPLLEKGDLKHFILENVSYRRHNVTVIYDSDGSEYGIGAGLFVYVDGTLKASSKTLTSLKVPLK